MWDVKKIVETYNKTAEHYAKSRQGKEPKEELAKFIKLVKPHGKVLDVGCAAGRDSRILKDAGFDVTGMDLSEELLKIAKTQNPDVEFILTDMRILPFGKNFFDGIWACAVLHHLDKAEMASTVQEFKRVLKTNGILFIKTKMGKGVLKTQEEMILNEEREFNLMEEEELDQMLTVDGFEKIELFSTKAKTREIFWINAFYRKQNP
ncbi:MAG TPA: class I SAM-dependent methyltransferase [Xanthomonadales bacterium]|nr:class I SAM-dependent methyltransferase [Xanthomonadales bacterium]